MAVPKLFSRIFISQVFLFSALTVLRCSSIGINLGGAWTISNANGSVSVTGNVPGTVHMALFQNGEIDDPYFRFNDVKYRWIAYEDWTYRKDFQISKEVASKEKVVIVCDGLDTVAAVRLNGKLVGTSSNMFHRYIFDVKFAIKPGTNRIQVNFTSAITYSKKQFKDYSYNVPPNCTVPVQRGECHANFIRKEQCSFSWDWGPAFAPQGIWRNISIQAYDTAVIRDVTVTPIRRFSQGITWQLAVSVFLDAASDIVHGSVHLSLPELSVCKEIPVKSLAKGEQKLTLPLMNFTEKDKIKEWWPRGYGNQPLYTVKVMFVSGDETSDFIVRTGFRTVKLVQEPIPGAEGLGFHFEINDLAMFLKGANWIPADSFEDRVNTSVLRNLLQSTADANMNVVRNWGGGIYQHDDFYTIADELGLLVWEEFMFACSMYPTNQEFLLSVQEEVRYQARRLQHHPSLFVWSGNNENEAALAQDWYQTDEHRKLYISDYVKLYVDTIRKTLLEEDSSRPFISSSPSNGVETEREGWVSNTPDSPYWGDVHFYDYTMDCWDVSGYPKPRFASEYGFQSYPSFETLAEVSTAEDWTYSSDFMDHRQHHGSGNNELLMEIRQHFKLPTSSNLLKKFKDTLFLTQVVQAQCMKTETEHYRRLQSELIQGEGKTMGTIYWQLNSIWQAPTWSSLEYGGKWKMLHYYARNFYSPVIASAYEDGGKFKLYVVSDLLQSITNGTVRLVTWSWSSFVPVTQKEVPFGIKRQSSKQVYTADISELLSPRCASRNQCFVTMTPVNLSSGEILGPNNTFYLSSFSELVGLKDPELKITSVKSLTKTQFVLSLQAQSPACFVWLKSGKIRGRFSDNGFLQTKTTQEILFYAWQQTTTDELQNSLAVSSLYDVYN